jgi:carbamoyltransferase
MSQLILGVHPGPHDATAAVFEGYVLRAAVQLERLTRRKNDGQIFPNPAIDEALSIIGATRRDVDVVVYSRSLFPTRYYRRLKGLRWLREQWRSRVKNKTRRMMVEELARLRTIRVTDVFDIAAFQRDIGFRNHVVTDFYNHHEAHALAPLFYSSWDNAFIATADAGGDLTHYSYRHLADDALVTIFGGEDCILNPPPEDSLGKMYSAATKALGFRPARHEGKLTGLAALGEPILARRIGSHFSVDDAGRIHCDLPSDRHIRVFVRRAAKGVRREDVAASVQKVLEDVMLLSIRRLLARHPSRNLGLAGGVFANVRLNRLLAETLPLDELFVFPAMGDEGLAVGGVLCHLLKRDGLTRWLANRRPLGDVCLGRNYFGAIDCALKATPGIGCTGEAPVEGAVRRLVPAGSARSIPAGWNTDRARSAHGRSSPIRRFARLTIC